VQDRGWVIAVLIDKVRFADKKGGCVVAVAAAPPR